MSESAIDLFAPAAHDAPLKKRHRQSMGGYPSLPSRGIDSLGAAIAVDGDSRSLLRGRRGTTFAGYRYRYSLRSSHGDHGGQRRGQESAPCVCCTAWCDPPPGRLRWQGRLLDRAARRRQAMVFQRPVMLRRSVRGNLRFALAVRGIGGGDRARSARPRLLRGPALRIRRIVRRDCFPAASSSVFRWRGRCRPLRRCFFWTSRWRASIRHRPTRSNP